MPGFFFGFNVCSNKIMERLGLEGTLKIRRYIYIYIYMDDVGSSFPLTLLVIQMIYICSTQAVKFLI